MPSVAQAASAAFRHTERILFRPFSAEKWFALGFSAFLMNLGGGFSLNIPSGGPQDLSGAGRWVESHLPLVITLGIIVLVVIMAVGITLMWLSCRGQFMFLDNVVRNEHLIREPWQRFRAAGNRLFLFQLKVILLMVGVGIVIAAAVGLFAAFLGPATAWNTLMGMLTIAVLALLGLVLMVAMVLFFLVLHDFGVPLMYRRGMDPGEALTAFRQELLPGRGGVFVRFYLLKLVMGMGAGILAVLGGCLTCCIGFLPYLSSVLTLPVPVFFRSYALDLLAQIDPDLDLFATAQPSQETQP